MEQTLKSSEIIKKVGEYLRKPIPTTQKDLKLHVIGLDALRYDLAEACYDSMQTLYQKRKQMLWPKDVEKGLTELDRNTRLNGDVAVLERDYHFLLKLQDLVESRIELALSLT